MKVWIVTVIVLFCLVELYQWVRGFMLPLPIYVLAGAFLSIASNYDKGISTFFKQVSNSSESLTQTATLEENINLIASNQEDVMALEQQKESQ